MFCFAQQNLVPNPSFEDTLKCPLFLSEIPYSKNYNIFKSVAYWSNPVRLTTPDYFHKCTPSHGQVEIPYNIMGHQFPRTGDAYAGIVVYHGTPIPTGPQFYSEYIYCKLKSPLAAGSSYTVSFYVSATFPAATRSNSYYAVDRIGAHLSDTIAYREDGYKSLNLPFHIRNPKNNILNDTISWVEVSGKYIAKGGEEYMYIGNFYAANDTMKFEQIFPEQPAPAHTYFSYYYIDDVSVRLDTHCDTFTTATETKLCANEFITLSSSVDTADSYTWNQGQGSKNINVYQPGTYWVAATKDTCDLYVDTFYVKQFSNAVINFYTRVLCTEDSSSIELIPTVSDADSFLWSTGASSSTISVSDTGLYSCTSIKGCDIHIDYFTVHSIELEDELSLGNDTLLCDGITYTLGNQLSDNINYKWNTGANVCCIDITNSGNYILSITNGCNTKKDSINVEFYECVNCISVPTAFTPNNDGLNDVFKVLSRCPIEEYKIIIVNRWGEQVFTSDDVSDGWDGTFKGHNADIGAYHFLIQYRALLAEQKEIIKGDISLIR